MASQHIHTKGMGYMDSMFGVCERGVLVCIFGWMGFGIDICKCVRR